MDPWEVLEYVGELLVFLGVVGEVFAEWREPHRRKLGKVSSIVLVLGLALSLAALKGTNEDFNGRIADLNLKASRANDRASASEKDAAIQRARAACIEKQLLTLWNAAQPRSINVERVKSKLKSIQDVHFELFAIDDAETLDFSKEVEKITSPTGRSSFPWFGLPTTGIYIEVASFPVKDASTGRTYSEDERKARKRYLLAAAAKLQKALLDEGLSPVTIREPSPTEKQNALFLPVPNSVGIYIGRPVMPTPKQIDVSKSTDSNPCPTK